MICMIIFAI
jgi:hypothetical protein